MTKIFVSAGHSSSDPGAVYHSTTEYKELSKILPKAISLARPHLPRNHTIVEVPPAYGYVEAVQYFLKYANRSTDLFTEAHLNANVGNPGTGTETWYGSLAVFARVLNDNFVRSMRKKHSNWANRGVKQSTGYYITRVLANDGNIIELGFLNNKTDLNRLRTQGAVALAEALLSVAHEKPFSLPAPKPPTPKPAPKPEPKPKFDVAPLPVPLDLKLRRDAHLVYPENKFKSHEMVKSGSDFTAYATFETDRKYYLTQYSYGRWRGSKTDWLAIEADALEYPSEKQLKDIEIELRKQSGELSELKALITKVVSFLAALFKNFKV